MQRQKGLGIESRVILTIQGNAEKGKPAQKMEKSVQRVDRKPAEYRIREARESIPKARELANLTAIK